MIKMLCQVPRRQGMSAADFYPRYLEGHGQLVSEHAKAMGFLRYVQAHRIVSPEIDRLAVERGWRAPMDGQSELWWDGWSEMEAALASAEGIAASASLEVDEQAFTDTVNVSGFIAIESVVCEFGGDVPAETNQAVKIVLDHWRRASIYPDAFGARWHGSHADLIRDRAPALGISKYVQNHRDPAAKFDFADLRGWQPAPDGVTEIWWPDIETMKRAISSDETKPVFSSLLSDLDDFTDSSLTRGFSAREHVIFDFVDAVPLQG